MYTQCRSLNGLKPFSADSPQFLLYSDDAPNGAPTIFSFDPSDIQEWSLYRIVVQEDPQDYYPNLKWDSIEGFSDCVGETDPIKLTLAIIAYYGEEELDQHPIKFQSAQDIIDVYPFLEQYGIVMPYEEEDLDD